ncbi:probable protein phosphatase 2C 23 [Musa acuminata AAA Group]|uniref:probable protein phosphatase 2C 23 n=1 Tax=Musa acuminata AAA Group TaxID=214697 RepID=UPI0031DA78F4
MGNRLVTLAPCFSGDGRPVGAADSAAAAAMASEPVDEGLGHSFVYVGPDVPHLANYGSDASSSSRVHHSDEGAATGTTMFRSISGASVSANAATPLSTAPLALRNELACSSAASFESSSSFASVPLQPRHSGSLSGPIGSDRHYFSSGHLDRGFHSGPIENQRTSCAFSGPLDRLPSSSSSSGHFYRSLSQRLAIRRAARHSRTAPALIRRFTKYLSRTATRFSCVATPRETSTKPEGGRVPNLIANLDSAADPSSNSTTINSSGNDQMSFDCIGDESDSSDGTNGNLHWAQGKAGEDRTHVVVSEEHGWVFVGIYDGFNGPDATDYLLANLYPAIQRELKGLLWDDPQNTRETSTDTSQELDDSCCEEGKQSRRIKRSERNMVCDGEASETNRRSKEQLTQSSTGGAVDHRAVLKAISRALRKTEEAYLHMANTMVSANPELALMGSCVLVMLMRGEDVYLMNVGDSCAVLARRAESDLWNLVGQATQDLESIRNETLRYLESYDDGDLLAVQLTLDHSTCNDEEVRRIRNEHPDDPGAIVNNRVKGSLKVTRAFGAGYLKQPKWNNALLGAFKIDYKGTSPYITCNPFLCYHRIGPKDKYLILSSDGLYQYFTNEEVVTQVEMFTATNPDGDPAQYLVEEVLYRAADKAGMEFNQLLDVPQGDRRKYHDDVSIIIISLEGRMWRSCA